MPAQYSGILKKVWAHAQHFNYEKYWKMRDYVVSHGGGLKSWLYLYRIKKMDTLNHASMGTHISFPSAVFLGHPILPHGLNGIIIANDSTIGRNCTIYHQVTISGGVDGGPIIGDNVLIGAGAKIIGNVKIGNNAKIGAGCIVTVDVPDNATAVMPKPRIILHDDKISDIVD